MPHGGPANDLPYAPSPALDGVSLYSYGHSYSVPATMPQASTQYIDRVIRRFGMTHVSRGIGATQMSEIARTVLAGSPFVAGTRGVVVLDGALNDIRLYGSGAIDLIGFELSLRAALAALTAASRMEAETDPGFAYTGTWLTNGDAAWYSGGVQKYTSTQNDYTDITFVGDSITVELHGYRVDTPSGATVQFLDVSASPSTATMPANLNLNGIHSALYGYAFGQYPVTISGWGPGTHTLRVKKVDANGTFLSLDCAFIPSASPVPIFLMLSVPLDWTRPNNTTGPWNLGTDAAVTAYNNVTRRMAGSFPSVRVLDPISAGVKYKSHIYTGDDVHLNNRGNAAYADLLAAALMDLPFAEGLNAL